VEERRQAADRWIHSRHFKIEVRHFENVNREWSKSR